jgi:hypothetical protein
MSGTMLEHPLVRDYLRRLDAACAGLPAARTGELREQITAHLEEGTSWPGSASRRCWPPRPRDRTRGRPPSGCGAGWRGCAGRSVPAG